MNTPLTKIPAIVSSGKAPSRMVLDGLAANELIFAVVGPVGSGTSEIAETLETLLLSKDYDATILKARTVIEEQTEGLKQRIKAEENIQHTQALQDAGDSLRRKYNDNAAVAIGLVDLIRRTRAKKTGVDL